MTTRNRRGRRIEMLLLLLQSRAFRGWTQTEIGCLSHVQRRARPDCHVGITLGETTIDCLRGVLLNRGLPGAVETEEKMKPKRKPAMLPYLTIQGEREFCGAEYGNIGNLHTVYVSFAASSMELFLVCFLVLVLLCLLPVFLRLSFFLSMQKRRD